MKNLFLLLLAVSVWACTPNQNSEHAAPDDSTSLTLTKSDSVDYLSAGMALERDEEFGGLKTGLSSDDVKKLFGDATNKSEVTFSEADGMNWQTYFYPGKGFEISFFQNADSSWETGSYLLKENTTLKSTRGIGIGSTAEEVRQVYRKEIDTADEGPGQIIAGSVYGGIVFWMTDDGKVRNIFVGASAE